MTLTDMQAAIVETLETALAGAAATVQMHRGQFENLDEIRRLAVKNPAVLVSLRGFRHPERLAEIEVNATVQWVVYVLTADRPQLPRFISGTLLTAVVVSHLDDQRWGADTGAPEDIVARNITTTEIDKAGVCLWSVAWLQAGPITDTVAMTYGRLNEIFGTHELGNADQATDLITIAQ